MTSSSFHFKVCKMSCNSELITYVKVLVTQLCLTLCNPMDCSLPGSRPWNSPGKNTVVDRHSLLQGIFPTQGSNPGLLHCRQILYYLSHQGSPCEYIHSTLKKKEILSFVTRWMNLEGIMLIKISQGRQINTALYNLYVKSKIMNV